MLMYMAHNLIYFGNKKIDLFYYYYQLLINKYYNYFC